MAYNYTYHIYKLTILPVRCIFIVISGLFSLVACKSRAVQVKLNGYDLSKPIVYKVPRELNEISGIAFYQGTADTVYAIQDEKGILFCLSLPQGTLQEFKFGKKGDYEDIAITNNQVIILRSDGTIFRFKLRDRTGKDVSNVAAYQGVLPEGEFESLSVSADQNELYVLCKSCSKSHGHNQIRGFQLSADTIGVIGLQHEFTAPLKGFVPEIDAGTVKASAMAQHPLTGDWYVACSVGKTLLVYTRQWKPISAVPLDPSLFTQPEGIAFDKGGDLYISNEASGGQQATILEFHYQPAGKQ